MIIMKALSMIFAKDKITQTNKYHLMFESKGGIDVIESLQNHPNSAIYE